MGLLIPFPRIAYAVGDTLAHDALVELSLTEFDKESADARLAIKKIVDGETFVVEDGEESVGKLLHTVLGTLTEFAQTGGILVEESRFG